MKYEYLHRIYSGFLGMNIGIRLGAPVEPTIWTYERILKTYGEIRDYVKEYKNFAADDDTNGPVFFLRALSDKQGNDLTPQDVAHAWLNYSREGRGMFWWGGYGISTEHTAYLNLKNGIPAPQSGSIEQNGSTLAEQIGGQIFIDTWGLINPGHPERAAHYAEISASVSHDGNGLYGARFISAAVAAAFLTSDAAEIIRTALEQIPSDSTYHAVVSAVCDFHESHPDNWRDCYQMLHDLWGYDRYPGVCHIIPNAGVCAMALIYGENDFSKTIEIATMAGWDTDCNAGNVGTIMGVACGINKIPPHYRRPINDAIVCSGISGSLNILDIPTFCKEMALLAYRLDDETPPYDLVSACHPGEIYFDFNLPGSTHGMRVSDSFLCQFSHADDRYHSGQGSLKIVMDRMSRGESSAVYYKPFYTRADFSDERYSPVFSPTVYSGQTVSMMLFLDQWNGNETPGAAPYIRTASDGKRHLQGYQKLIQGEWMSLSFTIPDTDGDCIDEVGIILESYSPASAKTLGVVYLDEFSVSGKSEYAIEIAKQRSELGTVTPFSVDHGAWNTENNQLNLICCCPSYAYTGQYYSKNYEFTCKITPLHGVSHRILCRAQGAMRFYSFGFGGENLVTAVKNNCGLTTLSETSFPWELRHTYEFKVRVKDDEMIFYIDGQEILKVKDAEYAYGMYGCGADEMARCAFDGFHLKEI